MLKQPRSLLVGFLVWILLGFVAIVVFPTWTKQSWCGPEKKNVSAKQTQHDSDIDHGDSKKIENPASANEKKTDRDKSDANSSSLKHLPPEWLCEETKITDLAIAYFTYCLVVVGWFGIRSGEKTARELERAYIFVTPFRPTWNGTETIISMVVSNPGKTAGIIKTVYGEVSAQEPSGTPRYEKGTSRFVDGLSAPNDKEVPFVPARWTSPFKNDHYFFGYVRYIDVFRIEHESRFCCRIFPALGKIDIAGGDAWNDWN